MGCPKNPKKFLGFIPYEGPHDFELESVDYFAWFTLNFVCTVCGSRRSRWPVGDEHLIRMGYDVKRIRQRQGDALHLILSRDELEEFRESAG